jgi:hypothetical protein
MGRAAIEQLEHRPHHSAYGADVDAVVVEVLGGSVVVPEQLVGAVDEVGLEAGLHGRHHGSARSATTAR